MNDSINVSINYNRNKISVIAEGDEITVEFDDNTYSMINKNKQDFAVWLFLPIAMRLNKNLNIIGNGSTTTIRNAVKMSEIWSMWLPSHFNRINVSFDKEINEAYKQNIDNKTLCFYSGGIDSTYCIKDLSNKGIKPSLLTVHGMDYKTNNNESFDKFKLKTSKFEKEYGENRFFIKTNAYSVYDKYRINLKKGHITHIFTLAACGFLFSENFSNIIIASDYRLDQQFLVLPYGSNLATNFLFNDGQTSLISANADITRSEKLPLLLKDNTALECLTFCVDKKSRPNNCGICNKCVRTKLMFLATTGEIPDIFETKEFNDNILKSIDIKNDLQRTFILDLYYAALKNNRLSLMPKLENIIKEISKPSLKYRIKKFLRPKKYL